MKKLTSISILSAAFILLGITPAFADGTGETEKAPQNLAPLPGGPFKNGCPLYWGWNGDQSKASMDTGKPYVQCRKGKYVRKATQADLDTLKLYAEGLGTKVSTLESLILLKADSEDVKGLRVQLDTASAEVTDMMTLYEALKVIVDDTKSRLGEKGAPGSYEDKMEATGKAIEIIRGRLDTLEDTVAAQGGRLDDVEIKVDQLIEDKGTGASVLSVSTGLEFSTIFNHTLPRLGIYVTPAVVFGRDENIARLQVSGKFGYGGLREQDLPGADLGGRLAADFHLVGEKLDADILTGFELSYCAINDQFRNGSTFALLIGGVELYPHNAPVKISLLAGIGEGFANDGDSLAGTIGIGVSLLWWGK